MPVTVINDNDLRQRLEEHAYCVPPITDTTRKILIKKLNQLDEQQKQAQVPKKKGGYVGIDYSSAEDEDFPAPIANSTRRVSVKSSNGGGVVGQKRGRVTRNSRQNSRAGTPQNGASTSTRAGGRRHPVMSLMSNSETEEGSEEEEEEDICEEEEEEEESEEEEEVNGGDRVDLGVQTSLLDSPSPVPSSQTRFRGQRLGGSQGSSTTPQSYPTSHQGNNFSSPPVNSGGPGYTATPTYPMLSPYLRKNLNKHGSLNEALSTLPQPKVSSPPEPPPSPPTPTTQVTRSQNYNSRLDTSTSSASSKLVSSLIITAAAIFFIFLGYQYINLVPAQNKAGLRIPICGGLEQEVPHQTCVPSTELNDSVSLYKPLVKILPTPQDCKRDGVAMISISEIIKELDQKPGIKKTNLPDLLDNLVVLLKQNPDWGILVTPEMEGQEVQLSVVSRPLTWLCWAANLTRWVGGLLANLAGVIAATGLVLLVTGLVYFGWVWWSAARDREKQEVFLLVEQATGILYQQHQMVTREGKGGPSYLAIDHIRDQLIQPKDRKGKVGVWKKVVEYIRNHESRVREDVQHIFGEEFRVWQWLPDLAWSPSSPAPPPPSSPSPPPAPPPNKWPHVPTTQGVLPGWQGQAFQLGKHVAAPLAPPTSCLKVRHMFDVLQQVQGWERAVKEEIVRRCSDARILHIAVDTKSEEGTVYIKTQSTEDAGKVFRCLHGQWYRGQLVTAKYLRLERYHERFPESAGCTAPLQC